MNIHEPLSFSQGHWWAAMMRLEKPEQLCVSNAKCAAFISISGFFFLRFEWLVSGVGGCFYCVNSTFFDFKFPINLLSKICLQQLKQSLQNPMHVAQCFDPCSLLTLQQTKKRNVLCFIEFKNKNACLQLHGLFWGCYLKLLRVCCIALLWGEMQESRS